MTTITVKDCDIEVNGHAGYAQPGQDIVCAAVSILCYTLAYNLSMSEGHLISLCTDMSDGKAHISCVPQKQRRQEVTRLFGYIINGFKLLQKKYPDHIMLEVV